jgi:hypothetical protein
MTSVALAQMSRGPVEATFWVYSDFMNYKKGVYIRPKGAALLGGHAVKVGGPLSCLSVSLQLRMQIFYF